MKTVSYGLYLSTNTSINSLKPVDKTNLNRVKWTINWKEIFGSKEGECRIRVKLVSNSATNLVWNDNVGSVRGSFSSNYQNSNNGFNLGSVIPVLDNTAANSSYLDCDTRASKGISMVIPKTNTEFSLQFLNSAENAMVNVPEYQIWLYFDVEK
jgi:hypothetical protein